MSEMTTLIDRWNQEYLKAKELSEGGNPVIVVVGHDDYYALLTAIRMMLEGSGYVPINPQVGPLEFMGVKAYPCHNVATGFFFGSLDKGVSL